MTRARLLRLPRPTARALGHAVIGLVLALGLAGCPPLWPPDGWPPPGHPPHADAGVSDAPRPTTPDVPAGDAGGLACAVPGAARRFSLVVLPDTQYLFDQDRGDPAVLEASLRWVIENRQRHGIAFVAQLGDLVENAARAELAQVSEAFGLLDRAGVPYSVLAGNHDLRASNLPDDQRGGAEAEPYLELFGPGRFAADPTFVEASPSGFNRAHVFSAAGARWLLLALDWRPSDASLAWAGTVLDRHPDLPVVVTTHELATAGEAPGTAALSPHGQRLWDGLIRDRDQVFLTLNGPLLAPRPDHPAQRRRP